MPRLRHREHRIKQRGRDNLHHQKSTESGVRLRPAGVPLQHRFDFRACPLYNRGHAQLPTTQVRDGGG